MKKRSIKMDKSLIKSVSESQDEILRWIMQLYAPDGFDLDPTYSRGLFYKNIPKPLWKFDIAPQIEDTLYGDCTKHLPFEDGSLSSIVFDPPFIFGGKNGPHGKQGQDIMGRRFGIFFNYDAMKNMYCDSLAEFKRILRRGGYIFFKCQDFTDTKTTMTHCLVYQWATELGFYAEDLFILIARGGRLYNPQLTQRHARKFHSYWWVFKK